MSAFLAKAQIFTWKNLISLLKIPKTDSIVSKKLNKEFFKKDTANFVWKEKKKFSMMNRFWLRKILVHKF